MSGHLLTSDDLCARWHINPRQLRDMRYRGEIAYIKVGRFARYALTDVEAYEAARRVEGVAS